MNKLFKTLFWVGATLVVLVTIYFAIILYFASSFTELIEEVDSFAKTTTKEGCLKAAAKRLENCDELSCLLSSVAFSNGCIALANGDKNEFCSTHPKNKNDYTKGTWLQDYCAPHNLNRDSCEVIFETIIEYCGNSD